MVVVLHVIIFIIFIVVGHVAGGSIELQISLETVPHRRMFVPAHCKCLFSILLEHPSRWIPHRVGEHHLDQSLPRHGLYGRHDDSRCARFLTTR